MKGLIGGGVEVGSLETTKSKLVMAGIQQRGWWDIIRFRWDEWELEVEIKEDAMVDGGEMLEFELGSLCMKPFKDSSFISPGVRLLENLKIPLALLCMSWQVVDVVSNGGLIVRYVMYVILFGY